MSDPSTPATGTAARGVSDLRRFNLIGESEPFLRSVRLIEKIGSCDAATLVQGETGTGKELAARAIHYLGARADYPFIPVNCGAIPDNLLENELFGHARGAYTDARESARGLIADAEGGTLFLDEVDSLSSKAQVALLRFLQDGMYRPLGAKQSVQGDVRIIAASNTDLTERAVAGAYRWDLLYRLRIMTIDLPPLRQRSGDVRLLADYFLRRFAFQYRRPLKAIEPVALARMARYHWPGNVRELENLIHREFLLSETPLLQIGEESFLARAEHVCEAVASSPAAPRFALGFNTAKAMIIEEFERTFLCWALSQCGGNVSLAARRCGKERRTFGKLLKKHGIDKAQYMEG
jgi:two-component system, NtrC family, response regulator GlrR